MALDLRTYIKQTGTDLCFVDKEISPVLETSIIINKLDKKKRTPVICFTNVLIGNGDTSSGTESASSRRKTP